MSKTITVSLGGTDYIVPMLNLDQLERVGDMLDASPKKGGFGVLRIAFERSDPKPENPGDLAGTRQEIKKAVDEILKLSGFEVAPSPNVEAPAMEPGESQTSSTSTDV